VNPLSEIFDIVCLKPWVDRGLVLFLILYAIFGLSEVLHHLSIAIVRFRVKRAKRCLLDVLVCGAGITTALGPLYISLELLEYLINSGHA